MLFFKEAGGDDKAQQGAKAKRMKLRGCEIQANALGSYQGWLQEPSPQHAALGGPPLKTGRSYMQPGQDA